VFAIVLIAAILVLAIPLGTLWLLGKFGGDEPSGSAFNPAVGECVKNAENKPVEVDCAEAGAFKVVSKVDNQTKCADQNQPHVEVPGGRDQPQVLCLQPVSAG
jgi:hypothetical protein